MSNEVERPVTEIKIITQGAPLVNDAIVYQRGETIAAIIVDMRSKRCEAICFGYEDNIPSVMIMAGEDSNQLKEGEDHDAITEISFPEFLGWKIWINAYGKYSVNLCLIKDDSI